MERDLSDAIAYFRVSSEFQAREGHAFDDYYRRMKNYGFRDDQIYSDVASGNDETRKGYQLVLAQVRAGKRRVFVPEFLRLTRSPGGWEEAMEDFRRAGASVVILGGVAMSFETPEDRYMARLMVGQGALERERNQYRSLKGFEFLRFQGKALRHCFGYKKENARLIPNLDEYKSSGKTVWAVARELVESFLTTGSCTATLTEMGLKYGAKLPGRNKNDYPRDLGAFKAWLENQTLLGNIEYFAARLWKKGKRSESGKFAQNQIVYGTHEPLITREERQEIDRLLAAKYRRRIQNRRLNLFPGLCYCVGCGELMKLSASHTTENGRKYAYDYLVCSLAYPPTHKKVEIKAGQSQPCDRRSSYSLTVQKVEVEVIKALCAAADRIANEVNIQNESPENPEVVALREQLFQYEKLAAIDLDLLPIIEKKRRDLAALLSVEMTDETNSELRDWLVQVSAQPGFWESCSALERQHFYSKLIDRIECDRGTVVVVLRV
jgi:DNA invertase Pin-like site-specific DNA recombinase